VPGAVDQRQISVIRQYLTRGSLQMDGVKKTFETVRLRGHAAGARNGALGLGQLVVRWVA